MTSAIRRTALLGRPLSDGPEGPSYVLLATGLLGLTLLAGCEKPAYGPGSDPAQKEAATDKAAADAAAPVQLDIASWDDVQKYVAAQKGKVVVLDLWSTSCEPCVKELPRLVKLHQAYPHDVVCVSNSLDFYGLKEEPPESYRDQALEILTEKGATFQNYLCSDADTKVYEQVGANPVPIVLVYDRAGKLAKLFENEFTYERDVAPLVKELVAAKGS
ncbi:MAG TPA: TlpA disulfide reductase family protein [Pirellulaceae bacterium]|nr:TlpA disulfide reductase family protein [Pirellulaceae bacterium]